MDISGTYEADLYSIERDGRMLVYRHAEIDSDGVIERGVGVLLVGEDATCTARVLGASDEFIEVELLWDTWTKT
jgi:hypothetical protein